MIVSFQNMKDYRFIWKVIIGGSVFYTYMVAVLILVKIRLNLQFVLIHLSYLQVSLELCL